MNNFRTIFATTLVVGVLVSMSALSLRVIGSMISDADVASPLETLDVDFLSVDAPRLAGRAADGAEEESIRTLNDWTFTRRTNFSRVH